MLFTIAVAKCFLGLLPRPGSRQELHGSEMLSLVVSGRGNSQWTVNNFSTKQWPLYSQARAESKNTNVHVLVACGFVFFEALSCMFQLEVLSNPTS